MTRTIDLVQPAAPEQRAASMSVFEAVFSRPAAILAFAVPYLAASVLGVVATALVLGSEYSIIVNGALETISAPDGRELLAGAIALALTFVATVFAATAAELVIASTMLSRTLGVVDAWRGAIRIFPRTLLAAFLVAAIFALVAGIAFLLTLIGLPLVFAIGLFAVVGILLFPVLYVFSLAVLRPIAGVWAEVRAVARRIVDMRMGARLPFVLLLLPGTAINALVFSLRDANGTNVVGAAAASTISVAVTVLTTVLVVSLLTRLTLAGIAEQKQPQPVELPTESTSSTTLRARWVATASALVLPFALMLGGVYTNPTNLTTTTSFELPRTKLDLQSHSLSNGSVLSFTHAFEEYRLALCENERCDLSQDVQLGITTAMAPGVDGGVVTAHWEAVKGASEGTEWRLVVSTVTADDLAATLTEEVRQGYPATLATSTSSIIDRLVNANGDRIGRGDADSRLSLAIDTSGAFPVVATYNALTFDDEQLLSIYHCADAQCTSAVKHSTAVDVRTYNPSYFSVDLYVSADDVAHVTLSGFEFLEQKRAFRVLLATSSPSALMTVTQLSTSERSSELGFEGWLPAQIVASPDGLPFVLQRTATSGLFELIVCADQLCESSTTREVPGPDSQQLVPSLAIDESGRPLIATFSGDGQSVVVLSCVDEVCSAFESRTVARSHGFVSPLHLAFDTENRPLLTIANWSVNSFMIRASDSERIVVCQRTRCGAH